ncbi:thioredoxin-like protein [Agrocybe pediades]|nr:thioredoxin-like protein [Agrocybe pediades]
MSTPIPFGSSIRRRRIFLGILLTGAFLFFFVPWEIPLALRDASLSSLSRASIAKLSKPKKSEVKEIYGLLHLVTGDNEQEHVLSNAVDFNPTVPIDLDLYAAGNKHLDWDKERDRIDSEYPVIVFSKTYCPYSKRAKALFATYDLQPPPKVIEVDLRDDANMIKHLLTRLTHHSTFPNVLLHGNSIGGSDNLQGLHETMALRKLLEDAGATPRSSAGK